MESSARWWEASAVGSINLLLGSGSASRLSVAKGMGFRSIGVLSPDVNEKKLAQQWPANHPQLLVQGLSAAKGLRVVQKISEGEVPTLVYGEGIHNESSSGSSGRVTYDVTVTADQVVTCAGLVMEKPKDVDEARKFLQLYGSDDEHSNVCTKGGVVVTDLETEIKVSTIENTLLKISKVPDSVVEEIVAAGHCLHTAGALRIEDPLMAPFVTIKEGSWTSVLGLGERTLLDLLEQLAQKVALRHAGGDSFEEH